MKVMLRVSTLLLIFLISLQSPSCQSFTSKRAVEILKDGFLLIRLDMQKNKEAAYQKILANPKVNEKDKRQVEKKLQQHIEERLLYKSNVIKAFSENYSFSKLAFIENQNFKSFLDGNKNDIILTNANHTDLLNHNNYLLLAKGNNDGHWIVLDETFKRVDSPFPNSFGLGMKKLWDIFLGKKNFDIENQIKLAKKVNKAFNKAY